MATNEPKFKVSLMFSLDSSKNINKNNEILFHPRLFSQFQFN